MSLVRKHQRPKPTRGRKSHNFYEQLNFNLIRLKNGRNAAECNYCTALLKNTTVSRLSIHRNRCNSSDFDSNNSVTDVHFNSGTSEAEETTDNQTKSMGGGEDEGQLNVEPKEELIEELVKVEDVILEFDVNSTLSMSKDCSLTKDEVALEENNHNLPLPPKMLAVERVPSKTTATSSSLSSLYSSSGPTPRSTLIVRRITNTADSDAKEKIDVALAKLFFGCNIPFPVIESENFKKFMKTIWPSYSPPCRKTLSSTLLDKVHQEMVETNSTFLSNEMTLLIEVQDNSSNNTKNVVTLLQTVGGQCLYLGSYDVSDTTETGEALALICEQSIELAKCRYRTELYAVVSDHALNMMKMGGLVDLWHSRCNSHIGNLLIKDILDEELINKLCTILKEFEHSNLEEALLKNDGTRIKLPIESRWCSYKDSCACFVRNLIAMKKIAAEGNIKVKPDVILLLFDERFVEDIKNIIRLLDPICVLINKCQGSDFSLADAVEEWLSFKLPEDLLTNNMKAHMDNRIHMATNVYGLTSNYFHPVYRGKKLTDDQLNSVQNFLLDTLDADGLDALHAFEHNEDIFGKLVNKNVTTPKTFWGLTEKKYPKLAKVAQKLLKIPASSAQVERIFSNWSYVHSPLRNRLTSEESQKLLQTYHTLKLRDTNISDAY